MEVSCPKCSSRFNLPDNLAKPGAKLRCAVCKNVFQLPGGKSSSPPPSPPPVQTEQTLPPLKGRKKGRALIWLVIILLILGGAGAGYWFYFPREDSGPAPQEDVAKKIEHLTMRNVRQYTIANEKTGKISVIEGRVVNEFPEPKELIELEAAIYGRDKKPVAVKRQLAGTQLSLFQLQVLSEKEMESFLNNKMEILANNTNVPPGGEVPFMIIFYNPPEDLAEFGVKITDVKDVKGAR